MPYRFHESISVPKLLGKRKTTFSRTLHKQKNILQLQHSLTIFQNKVNLITTKTVFIEILVKGHPSGTLNHVFTKQNGRTII